MRVAVVGHVEWCEFAEVPHVPLPGEIVHATHTFQEPGGAGAVAAVQLRKLAGAATLFTAFGDDETGHRAHARLAELGVRVESRFRPEPQRRAFVHLDEPGERTITVLGPRLGPRGADDLAWEQLDETDAVYVTAGDVDAVRQARRARTLVATPRGLDTLADAHVELDALVASGRDPGELYRPGDLDPAPRVVVRTLGAAGGEWETAGGERGRWGPAELPGPVRDAYGCGDSFAAGLTYGLGAGWEIERAVELAARCGAACLTGRGPYEAQLTLAGS
jgi:ribokinase